MERLRNLIELDGKKMMDTEQGLVNTEKFNSVPTV